MSHCPPSPIGSVLKNDMRRPSRGSSTSSRTFLPVSYCVEESSSLEVIVCLFELVVEVEVALGQLEIAKLELFDDIVTEDIRWGWGSAPPHFPLVA